MHMVVMLLLIMELIHLDLQVVTVAQMEMLEVMVFQLSFLRLVLQEVVAVAMVQRVD